MRFTTLLAYMGAVLMSVMIYAAASGAGSDPDTAAVAVALLMAPLVREWFGALGFSPARAFNRGVLVVAERLGADVVSEPKPHPDEVAGEWYFHTDGGEFVRDVTGARVRFGEDEWGGVGDPSATRRLDEVLELLDERHPENAPHYASDVWSHEVAEWRLRNGLSDEAEEADA